MKYSVKWAPLSAAIYVAAIASPLHAEEQPSTGPERASTSDAGAEDIVVTATRRSLKLQDVAQSIQAIGGENLRAQGAVNFADYGRTVAGVSFQDDGPGRSQIFIRGVSTGGDVDTGKEATVGVYIDETPVTEGSSQPDLKLFDIDRVEVLRGPQGTLFGSGSLGGTVRIITNQPKFDDTAGYGEIQGSVTEGGGLNGAANAWLNLPVGEETAVRAVGYALHNSGFLDNGQTGEDDINDETTYGGRLAIRHQPSGQLNVVLTGMYQHTESGAYNRVADRYPALIIDQREPEPFTDRFAGINLKIEADLGIADLTSATSYFDRKRSFESDIDYFLEALAGIPRGRSAITYKARSFAQEVRATSKGDGPFKWLVGGFYISRDEEYAQTINDRTAPPASTSGDNLFYATTDGKIRQISGFGEVSYELSEGLTTTAGLRVSRTTRKADAVKDGLIFGGRSEEFANFKGTATTPKFNLSYKPDDKTLIYMQAAKGFRIGGTNPGLPPCDTCVAQVQPAFGSDSLWNYEIGVKSQPFGNSFTLNTSVFWIDWKNIQLNVNREDGFNGFVNAGRARSRGVEIEANGKLSRQISLGGQVTYTDAELRSLNPGLTGVAVIRAQLPQVPRWSAAGNVEWGTEVGADGRFYVRADLQYQGRRTDSLGATSARLDDYAIANFRIGLDRPRWKVAAFVTNITNTRAQLGRVILDGVRDGVPITLDRVTINTPRTFGLSFASNF